MAAACTIYDVLGDLCCVERRELAVAARVTGGLLVFVQGKYDGHVLRDPCAVEGTDAVGTSRPCGGDCIRAFAKPCKNIVSRTRSGSCRRGRNIRRTCAAYENIRNENRSCCRVDVRDRPREQCVRGQIHCWRICRSWSICQST